MQETPGRGPRAARPVGPLAAALIALAFASALVSAQVSDPSTPIDPDSPTSDWNIVGYTGLVPDPTDDQQTGIDEADIVGDANHGAVYAGFYDGGTPGDPTDGDLGFRVRVGSDKNPPGFGAFMGAGLDLDLDGAIDLFVAIDNSGANEIGIFDACCDLNISPSTTSIDNPPLQSYPLVTGAAGNYSWMPVDATSDPVSTPLDSDLDGDGDQDYFVTWVVPFGDVVTHAAALGFTIDENTPIRYVFGSSTQSNALNQDLGGPDGGVKSDETWEDLGALSDPVTPSGAPDPPIPPVDPGDLCLVGVGPVLAGGSDGWLGLVDRDSGRFRKLSLRDPTSGAPVVVHDVYDCMVAPDSGDVIVVDQGATGPGPGAPADGVVYSVNRIGWTTELLGPGVLPGSLVNPRGVAVDADGSIYVADVGEQTGAASGDGAVYRLTDAGTPAAAVTRLDQVGGLVLNDPTDVDVETRGDWTTPPTGLNAVGVDGHQPFRVARTGSIVTALPAGSASRVFSRIEVGANGNYFLTDDRDDSVAPDTGFALQRLHPGHGSFQNVWRDPGPCPPGTCYAYAADLHVGLGIDYLSGDYLIVEQGNGLTNVPASAEWTGGATPHTFLDSKEIDDRVGVSPANPTGVSQAPPLPSSLPSANFGVPTRRAPIPGAAPNLTGPHRLPQTPADGGDPEHEQNYFIRVTDSGEPLEIHLWDANVTHGYDYDYADVANGFSTALEIELRDPSGAVVASLSLPAGGGVALDQRIATLDCTSPPCVGTASLVVDEAGLGLRPGIPLAAGSQGVYQLRISAPDSPACSTAAWDLCDDLNVFGLWIEHFTSYTYAAIFGPRESQASVPVNRWSDPLSTHLGFWPRNAGRLYIGSDRGCEYYVANHDSDLTTQPAIVEALQIPDRDGGSGETRVLTPSDPFNPDDTHLIDAVRPGAASGNALNRQLAYGLHALTTALEDPAAPGDDNTVGFVAPDFNGWEDVLAGAPPQTRFRPLPHPRGNVLLAPPPAAPPELAGTHYPVATLGSSPAPAYNQEPSGGTWTPGSTPAVNGFLPFYLPRYDETPLATAEPYAPALYHSATRIYGDESVGSTAEYAIEVTIENPDPVNALTDVTLTIPVLSSAPYTTAGSQIAGPAQALSSIPGAPAPVIDTSNASCAPAPCSGFLTATWSAIPPSSGAVVSRATIAFGVTTSVGAGINYLSEGPRFAWDGISAPNAPGSIQGPANHPAANPAPPMSYPSPPALGVSMGTRARYTPAWSSAAFPRSESLGPVCQLAMEGGEVTPNAVDLAHFGAEAGDGEVLVTWETAAEYDNLGFTVYRRLAGESDFTRVSDLILGQGTSDFSARYALWDRSTPNAVEAEYLLEDVEITGRTMLHGPVFATPTAGALPPYLDPIAYAVVAEVAPALAPGGGVRAPALPTASASGGSLHVRERDASGLIVEVSVPEIVTAPVTIGGQDWTQVSADGYATTLVPGGPELPARSFWIEGADTSQVAIEVLERDAAAIALPAPVLPVATAVLEGGAPETSRVPDPAAYASSEPYPALDAALAGSVAAGDGERLLALRIQPARYVASEGVLETVSRLLLRIDFSGPAPVADAASDANLRAVAATPGVKIGARGRGLVRVALDELLAAGLDPAADPRHLHLFRDGRELSIRFEGEADGRLDAGDTLLFWAEGIDTRYSDEEAFFLIEGDTPGLRAPADGGAPGPLPGPDAVDARGRLEEQTRYLPGILNGEGDNYVGAFVFSSPRSFEVPTPAATGDAASVRVRLRGGTSFDEPTPDHHFSVRIGGVEILDALFDGTELLDASVVAPPWLVASDATPIEVVPLFDSSQPFLDLVYVDAFDVHYRRTLELRPDDAGQLVFDALADGAYTVTGLDPAAGVRVWDVSDPDAPRRLDAALRDADAVLFEGRAGDRYAVVADAGLRAASSVRRQQPSTWTAAGGGADWLAIAHASLLDGARQLAALREQQGLRTAVVDVEDVYDEISGGVATPHAIRDFVRRLATVWDPTPRYLVLVGDANYDYRDHLGGRAENLVSTMLVDTQFVEAASDSWFGVLDDASPAPQLAVGRLPVRDAAELAALVAKLRAYEEAPPEDWHARLLVVADDGLHEGDPFEAAQFEAIADAFRAELPAEHPTVTVKLSQIPEGPAQGETARAEILDALRDGASVAFYSGHGGPRVWADELVYDAVDAQTHDTAGRLPLVIALNCLNGFFDAPNEDSLSEAALRAPDRGALAYLSSTTVSALAGQSAFARALAERLGAGRVRVIGDAVTQAKQAIARVPGAEDVLRSWVLIGDPATRLALPRAPLADARAPALTSVNVAVALDGSGSQAPDGGPLSFAWRVVDEPASGAALLDPASAAQPLFEATLPGRYTLELRVSDGTLTSPPAVVELEALDGARGPGCAPARGEPVRLGGFDAVYLLIPLAASASRAGRRRRRRLDTHDAIA